MCVFVCDENENNRNKKNWQSILFLFLYDAEKNKQKKKEEKIAQDEIPKQTKQNKIIESDQRQKETIIIDDCHRRLRGRK